MAIRCLDPSPTDALIDLKIRCRLAPLVPSWYRLHTLARRIASIPQGWPTRQSDARRLCLHPDVVKDVADISVELSKISV